MPTDCFGLIWLGECSYDPSNPAQVYFSIGEAIAAAGIILILPQFLSPVYRFRLRAVGASVFILYVMPAAGLACAAFASLLPSLPFVGASVVGYPISWEILAGGFFAVPYFVLGWVYLRPAFARRWNTILYVRRAAWLLSDASDETRIGFLDDVIHTIDHFLNQASRHSQIRTYSAFAYFTYRHEIEISSYARQYFRLLSDKDFCRAVITLKPWDAAYLLRQIGENENCSEAEIFVQHLAAAALTEPETPLNKELRLFGFHNPKELASALFANPKLLSRLTLIERYRLDPDSVLNNMTSVRGALDLMLECTLDHGIQDRGLFAGVSETLEAVMRKLASTPRGQHTFDCRFAAFHSIEDIVDRVSDWLGKLPDDELCYLFETHTKRRDRDFSFLDEVAELIFQVFCVFSNDFKGHGDDNWMSLHSIWSKVFPQWGHSRLNPLQQRIIYKISDKLQDNFGTGYYPAISRVCAAMVGPYHGVGRQNESCAAALIRRTYYYHAQRYGDLLRTYPSKARDKLPENVTYLEITKEFVHRYSDNAKAYTSLAQVPKSHPELSLYDEAHGPAPQMNLHA